MVAASMLPPLSMIPTFPSAVTAWLNKAASPSAPDGKTET